MEASKKAAIRAYKERKTPRGIFAVRCGATGSVWVDSAMDLDAAKNRIWSCLKHGDAQMDKSILAAAKAHGLDAFTYEIVEKLDDDVTPMALRDLLKERRAHWIARLGSGKIWP